MAGRTNVGKPFSLSVSGNNSVSFNGSTQYGQVANYAALNTFTDCTIEYWIYNQGANASKHVSRFYNGSTEFVRDDFDGGGTNTANVGAGFAGSETYFGCTQASARLRASNTWEHNALVVDSSAKAISIYKNSSLLVSDFSSLGSGAQTSSNGASLYLACDQTNAELANIRIACFRIWSLKRTAAQLLANMNYYLDPTQETGLVLNCNFSEGSGTSVTNTVSGGNDIVLTATPSWTTGPSLTVKNYNGPRLTAGARTTAGTRTLAS